MKIGVKWRILGSGVLFTGFLGLILFSDKGLIELSRLREKERLMKVQNEALARENADLYRVIERLRTDPVYIERVARTELGMVGRDDQVVIFSDSGRKEK